MFDVCFWSFQICSVFLEFSDLFSYCSLFSRLCALPRPKSIKPSTPLLKSKRRGLLRLSDLSAVLVGYHPNSGTCSGAGNGLQ